MSDLSSPTRREFVKTASAVAAASLVGIPPLEAGQSKRRYAIVGTGDRATGMWGRPIREEYSDVVDFVGLYDINPKRALTSKGDDGRELPHLRLVRRDVR